MKLIRFKRVDDSVAILVWRIAAGLFFTTAMSGPMRGWVSIYRSNKALYFRVHKFAIAYYFNLNAERGVTKTYFVWPNNKLV